MRALFTAIILALTWEVSSADDGKRCATVTNAGERLLCYDGVFRNEVRQEAPDASGNWRVTTEKSKIDDSLSVFLSVESDEPIQSKFGSKTTPAVFWLRCMENKTAVVLKLGDHFLADINGFGDVTFRVDTKKAFTKQMDASTDNSALGLWSGAAAIPLIKQLYGATTLTIRATPYSEGPITTSFQIAGLEEKIEPLRKACGW